MVGYEGVFQTARLHLVMAWHPFRTLRLVAPKLDFGFAKISEGGWWR